MASLKFPGNLGDGKTGIRTELSLIYFVEEGTHIIFSPALDLSGYGNSETEAKESFQIVLQEFISYGMNKKTLLRDLEDHGWKVKGSKSKPQIQGPDLADMLKANNELEDIFQKKDFKKYNQDLLIPAF